MAENDSDIAGNDEAKADDLKEVILNTGYEGTGMELSPKAIEMIRERDTDGKFDNMRNLLGNISAEELASGPEGRIIISEIRDGSYTLTETEAPEEYLALAEPTGFVVKDGKISSADGNAPISDDGFVLTVENAMAKPLLNTGWDGTLPFIVAGLALILSAFVLRRRTMSEWPHMQP